MGLTSFQPASAAPIDLPSLVQLHGNDPELIASVLQLFVDDNAVRLADLEYQLEAGNTRAARRTAGTIRAAARKVSALLLSDYAEQVESLSGTGDVDGAETVFSMLREAFNAFVGAMSEALDAVNALRNRQLATRPLRRAA